MNISKNINLSKFGKILPGVFTTVYGFWVFISIIFCILMALFFIFIFPLPGQYARAFKDLEDLTIPLENYALRVKHIYNDKWITSKNLEAELYKKELEKCKSFLKGKDERLETFFTIEDTEKGLTKIEDEALWKNEYIKRVSALLTKLETNNITITEGTLPFHNWGSDIPTWDAILPVQKKFWILESLINIAINSAGITKLEKITFRESSYTYDPSFADIYTVIPITLKVELQANRIKFLIHEILRSDIPFVIESINILSTDKNFKPGSLKKDNDVVVEDADNFLPSSIIDVTFDAYVIDYKI